MAERIVQQPAPQATQEKFADLPTADVERSTFDMSHAWKGTYNAPLVKPILLMEILPADSFQISSTAFMRLATPLKPIFDGMTADIHYFFVPNRLVWDNWAFFMGERKTPTDDPTTVSVPQVTLDLDLINIGGLADAFGLPIQPGITLTQVNALPFRSYHLIWNEWYRNQNVTDPVNVPTDDGPDTLNQTFGGMLKRHKRADYFTRALPWPQKGDPVFLPLGTEAPVVSDGNGIPTFKPQVGGSAAAFFVDQQDSNVGFAGTLPASQQNFIWQSPNLAADLTAATAATINDIRTAFQIQRLLERDARGGTRLIEILLSHFNVQVPDFRLQRPEYLSGSSQRIMINPVASTVETTDAPQGNLAAVGTGLVKASMNHSFVEHGFLFGLLSVRTDLHYQQGLDRMWSRQTRYDYYWPALSHLGEQQILNKEIYFQDNTTDDETWGYQERYAEYRYSNSRITGEFRSVDPQSLDIWHLAEEYTQLPLLDDAFLYQPPPIDRVVAVPTEPNFLVDVWHDIKATRAMPVYAVPGLVDHF